MPATLKDKKVECLNPNTGRSMKIDKNIYDLISKNIYHALKEHKALSYTRIVDEVKKCLRHDNVRFEKSVEWYTVTVKHDMEARGVIKTYIQQGRKQHALA